MTQRRSEHNPATDPPGAVSNQNREDNQSGHRDDRTHPEPRTGGKQPGRQAPRRQAARDPAPGDASERSSSSS